MIIVLHGANGCGKDTIAELICKHSTQPFTKLSFAHEPNQLFKDEFNIDFQSLNRKDKELVRPQFIKFAESFKLGNEYYWADRLLLKLKSPIEKNYIITDLRFEPELTRLLSFANSHLLKDIHFIHISDHPHSIPSLPLPSPLTIHNHKDTVSLSQLNYIVEEFVSSLC